MREIKMKSLLIVLTTLTVLSSSHPLESTPSPQDIVGKNAILSSSANTNADNKFHSIKSQPEEIRLNITLTKGDETEKEPVDIDMGK
jgi:hypothetical protein